MDTRRPHEIKRMTDLQAGYGPGYRDPIERRRWLPITERSSPQVRQTEERFRKALEAMREALAAPEVR